MASRDQLSPTWRVLENLHGPSVTGLSPRLMDTAHRQKVTPKPLRVQECGWRPGAGMVQRGRDGGDGVGSRGRRRERQAGKEGAAGDTTAEQEAPIFEKYSLLFILVTPKSPDP